MSGANAGANNDPKKKTVNRGRKKEQAEARKNEIASLRGKPRTFPTEQSLQQSFEAYIIHCAEKKLQPNISGFCVFCDCTRETFYSYRDHYSDTIQKIRLALEDTLVNYNAFTGLTNPAMAIIQGKNTFGWDDSGRSAGESAHIDVDFDASEEELDYVMGKLGYLPKPKE